MIVDTSAILAILLDEKDAERYEEAIASAWPRRMSVIGFLEAAIVAESRGGEAMGREFDHLTEQMEMEWVPVSLEQAQVAREAWRRFGKGRSPARLNFGDCFAYALARTSGEPLLFKGGDFAQTDVEAA